MELRKRRVPKYTICKEGCMTYSVGLKWTEFIKQENWVFLCVWEDWLKGNQEYIDHHWQKSSWRH